MDTEHRSWWSPLGVVRRLFAFVAAALIVFATLILLVNVVRRVTTGAELGSAYGLIEVITAALAYLGAAFTLHNGGHVATDIVVRRLSTRSQAVATVLWALPTFIVVSFVSHQSLLRAVTSISRGEVRAGSVAIPTWPGRAAVAAGFTLLAIEVLVLLVRATRDAVGHHTHSPAGGDRP